jgi:hypothetical protein
MKKFSLYAAIAAGALLTGCLFQGQDSATGNANAKFQILAKTSNGDAGVSLDNAAGLHFTVTEARAYVGRVELKKATGAESSDELSVKGRFAINLLTGAATPDMGTLSVPAGVYREIEVKLEKAKLEDGVLTAGDDLLGHSLLIKGTFGATGTEKPFTLALDIDKKFEIENDSGINLDASALQTVLVSLKTDEWLKDLDLNACVSADSNGTVVLGKCLDMDRVSDNVEKSCGMDKVEGERHGGDDKDSSGSRDGRDSGKADTSKSGTSGHDGKRDSSGSGHDGDKTDSTKEDRSGRDSGKVDTTASGHDGHDSTQVSHEGSDTTTVSDGHEGGDSTKVDGGNTTGTDGHGGDSTMTQDGGHGGDSTKVVTGGTDGRDGSNSGETPKPVIADTTKS